MHGEPSESVHGGRDDPRPARRAQDPISYEPLALVDGLPLGLLLSGVLIAALLVALGAVSLTRDGPDLVRFAVAEPCPPDAPASGCTARLPGTIGERRDTTRAIDGTQSRRVAVLYAEVPDLPDDVRTFRGRVVLQMSPARADRIDAHRGAAIEVAFFAGSPFEVTGPNGVTARVEDGPVVRFAGVLALTFTLAGVLLLGSVLVRRRLRTSSPDGASTTADLPRWSVAVASGLVAAGVVGGLFGWATGRFLGAAWAVPTALATATIVGSITTLVSWRGLPTRSA